MKKRYVSIVLLLLFVGLSIIGAQSKDEFSAIVNFDMDLEMLSNLAGEDGGLFNDDVPLVILTGSVASRKVLRPGPEDYLGELELVDGRWLGLESVKTFRCIVQFSGPDYKTFIPSRRSRRPPPEEVPLNAAVLIVGKPLGIRETERGTVAIVRGFFVRILDK